MANIAEDENPRVVDKPYPRCGERWLHTESGHVVTVLFLHLISATHLKHTFMEVEDWTLRVKSYIPAGHQCVVYLGSDEKDYIRTVENFLERFERVG